MSLKPSEQELIDGYASACGVTRCTAQTKAGTRCMVRSVPGQDLCPLHNGAITGRSVANSTYGGKKSVMPNALPPVGDMTDPVKALKFLNQVIQQLQMSLIPATTARALADIARVALNYHQKQSAMTNQQKPATNINIAGLGSNLENMTDDQLAQLERVIKKGV